MNTKILTNRISRISWGAIIAGALTALAVSLLLGLLGVGIGLSTIDPVKEVNPLDGLGTGSLIWFIISNLIALFAGGWVAGRFAGFPNKKDGGLHGFMAWALYATISFIYLTSTALGAISGVGSAISSVFTSNNKEVTVNVNNEQNQGGQSSDMSLDNVKNRVFSLINKAEDLNILPNDTSEELRSKLSDGKVDADQMIKDLRIDKQIEKFVNNLDYNIDDQGNLTITAKGDYFDKESVKEYLAKHSDLTEQEINDVVNNWERKANEAIKQAEQTYNEAIIKAREYSQKTAETLAKIAIFTFFALLLGLIVAFIGGTLGAPKHTVEAVEDDRKII
ncbi:hypothetical protein KRX57_08960 [Weeksellaceae bacterium TAE3-ERU29]|nr:hypothetical protein [Weeksellaceae bacterium TAE3-ERU29]